MRNAELTPREILSAVTGIGLGALVMWMFSVVVSIFTGTLGFVVITGIAMLAVAWLVLSSIRKAEKDGVIR